MRCGGVAAVCVVAVLVASVVVPGSFSSHPSLSTPPQRQIPALSTPGHHPQINTTAVVRHGGIKGYSHPGGGEKNEPQQQSVNVVSRPGVKDFNFTAAQIVALRKLLLPPEEGLFNATVKTEGYGKSVSEEIRWQCFLEWLRIHSYKSRKDQRTCNKAEREQKALIDRKSAKECMPVLLLVVPALCNGTQSCVNLTEASMEELLHRYVVWERKKKRQEEADDAVIYIVVVLAFYSFGIVFMIANFVRQEQRELEETKMYKQYVKLARDRWLTTRGNMANKLALQALNTFNAIPQTTDVNKVTFV